ncbi:MAG: PCRF domain-containing protein, partial [Firmicutes bacterium]|nr:PCRF domain-containing protein [Bacillota bacterium]
MYDKLDFILNKYEELSLRVSEPELIANQPEWRKTVKEMSDMEPIVLKYREYKKAKSEIEDAKELLEEAGSDEEMKEMAKMEIADLEEKLETLEEEMK